MPIFSANRYGTVTESYDYFNTSDVGNYAYTDFYRIMAESVKNDQAVFEAMLCTDIQEAVSLREGTITLTEAEEKKKNVFKKALDAIQNGLTKVWEKIQKALDWARDKFRSLSDTISKKITKVKVDQIKKKLKDGKFKNFKCVAYKVEVEDSFNPTQMVKAIGDVSTAIDKGEGAIENCRRKVEELKTAIDSGGIEARKAATHGGRIDKITSESDITTIVDSITNSTKMIRAIGDYKNKCNQKINQLKKNLTRISKDNKSTFPIDEVRGLIIGLQNVLNTYTRDAISVYSKCLKANRKTINQMLTWNSQAYDSDGKPKNEAVAWAALADMLLEEADIDAEMEAPASDDDDNDVDINITVDNDNGDD